MHNAEILTEDEKFWGPKYGSIYPYLEDAKPYKDLVGQVEDYIEPKAGESWLDLGTGSGAMVDAIWRKSKGGVRGVTAVDLTETMLAHLRRRLPELSPPPREGRIKLVRHNLSNRLPFSDASFDGVVANLVLPYIETHEGRSGTDALRAIFSEVKRVLKNNGQFVWSSPVHGVQFFKVFLAARTDVFNVKKLHNLYHGPAILWYALKIQKKGKRGQYHFLPEGALRVLLTEAGFANIETAHSFAGQAIVVSARKK
ncbi:MAG: class I SAM-dependent methyltransferase [Parcubacteria group bacterium]|nr:class I SAM-dependent methyltransferase [Parcubacteria group bacterium]